MLGLLAAALHVACSDPEAQPGECSLPAEPEFDFTEVDLDTERSNVNCPEIAASALDTTVLAEEQRCEQAINNCLLELSCDYEGLTIEGRLAEREGGLVGRFDVETPIVCIYSVRAEWTSGTVADGGG
jgi:hypothetical protein